MTHDAMRRRYDALGTNFVTRGTLTREEHVELTYLFYMLTPRLAARLRDTPERIWGIVWCERCERAHVSGGCSIARQ